MRSPSWSVRGRHLTLGRPLVMGVVNVTPDSFSDGGQFASAEAAVAHACALLDEGADIIDVGGESTRPQGAIPVSADEELARILPVIRALTVSRPHAVISLDTVKAEVAEQGLAAGAHIVNDVSALRLDARMGRVVADAGAGVILMHSRGTVSDMATYAHADYDGDPVDEVRRELADRVEAARAAGVRDACIAIDPGIGFAKRPEASLRLLARLGDLAEMDFPIVVGASRKRFIGGITGEREPASRVHGSVGAAVAAFERGASVFRVHDVAATRQALDVAAAIRQASADVVRA